MRFYSPFSSFLVCFITPWTLATTIPFYTFYQARSFTNSAYRNTYFRAACELNRIGLEESEACCTCVLTLLAAQ